MLPITDINSRLSRYSGQIPIDVEAVRMIKEMPKGQNLNRYFSKTILTANSAVSDLGLGVDITSQWASIINKAIFNSVNELEFRKTIRAELNSSEFEPMIRNIIATRAIQLYKRMKKGNKYIIDLEKAEARGGNYYRRIPKPGGGYTYYYNEDDYHKNKNSHLDGDRAHTGYIGNKIKVILNNGSKDIKVFKGLVQKYGVDKVYKVVNSLMDKGNLVFKNKKFAWNESNR